MTKKSLPSQSNLLSLLVILIVLPLTTTGLRLCALPIELLMAFKFSNTAKLLFSSLSFDLQDSTVKTLPQLLKLSDFPFAKIYTRDAFSLIPTPKSPFDYSIEVLWQQQMFLMLKHFLPYPSLHPLLLPFQLLLRYPSLVDSILDSNYFFNLTDTSLVEMEYPSDLPLNIRELISRTGRAKERTVNNQEESHLTLFINLAMFRTVSSTQLASKLALPHVYEAFCGSQSRDLGVMVAPSWFLARIQVLYEYIKNRGNLERLINENSWFWKGDKLLKSLIRGEILQEHYALFVEMIEREAIEGHPSRRAIWATKALHVYLSLIPTLKKVMAEFSKIPILLWMDKYSLSLIPDFMLDSIAKTIGAIKGKHLNLKRVLIQERPLVMRQLAEICPGSASWPGSSTFAVKQLRWWYLVTHTEDPNGLPTLIQNEQTQSNHLTFKTLNAFKHQWSTYNLLWPTLTSLNPRMMVTILEGSHQYNGLYSLLSNLIPQILPHRLLSISDLWNHSKILALAIAASVFFYGQLLFLLPEWGTFLLKKSCHFIDPGWQRLNSISFHNIFYKSQLVSTTD